MSAKITATADKVVAAVKRVEFLDHSIQRNRVHSLTIELFSRFLKPNTHRRRDSTGWCEQNSQLAHESRRLPTDSVDNLETDHFGLTS